MYIQYERKKNEHAKIRVPLQPFLFRSLYPSPLSRHRPSLVPRAKQEQVTTLKRRFGGESIGLCKKQCWHDQIQYKRVQAMQWTSSERYICRGYILTINRVRGVDTLPSIENFIEGKLWQHQHLPCETPCIILRYSNLCPRCWACPGALVKPLLQWRCTAWSSPRFIWYNTE